MATDDEASEPSPDDAPSDPSPGARNGPGLVDIVSSRRERVGATERSSLLEGQQSPAGDSILARAASAFGPRAMADSAASEHFDAQLAAHREYVIAMAVRAIAAGWDSGRISHAAPGHLPFEHEVLGISGRVANRATGQVVGALDALAQAEYSLNSYRREAPSSFETLCDEHQVGSLGLRILMLVAAPTIWGEVARLYGILANDPARALCDEMLVGQLMCDETSRREIARELDADAPLVRRGIVRKRGPVRSRLFHALEVDSAVLRRLAGDSSDGDGDPGVKRIDATVELAGFRAPAHVIERALADLAGAPRGQARVVVRGRIGSGRRTLLATLAHLAGRSLAMIDVKRVVGEGRLDALLELLQRAHLRGWIPCVDGLESLGPVDESTLAKIRDQLRRHDGPLAVRLKRSADPALDPGYVMIDLPSSTIAEREDCWASAARAAGLALSGIDELSRRFSVGPGTIHTVVSNVAAWRRTDPHGAIDTALRQHVETTFGPAATRVTQLADWSRIVLTAPVEEAVLDLLARVRNQRTVFETWGFNKVGAPSRGITALFQGTPGTGKSLLASVLARDLGLDLYRVDLARVLSKWIGEAEQSIARMFDAAEEGQALLLFDEADSLFGHRTAGVTATDRHDNHLVNYLLQRLDRFDGFVVLTTNRGAAIDAAFRRRLTCCLTLPFPDAEAREQIWRAHLPRAMPIAGVLDLADLARRYEMSGGYIRNAVLRAAFLAADEQTAVSQFHLERAIRAEFREAHKQGTSGVLE